MRKMMIYKTWVKNRFIEINTSNEYDPDQPIPLWIKIDLYRWGIELEFVAIKYNLSIYVGYQDFHSIEYDQDGHFMYETKRGNEN